MNEVATTTHQIISRPLEITEIKSPDMAVTTICLTNIHNNDFLLGSNMPG